MSSEEDYDYGSEEDSSMQEASSSEEDDYGFDNGELISGHPKVGRCAASRNGPPCYFLTYKGVYRGYPSCAYLPAVQILHRPRHHGHVV